MKNIYDIRKENQDVYLLPNNSGSNAQINSECAIIVCLYYTEDIDFYLNYLSKITEDFPIYIYSSNPKCLEWAEKYIKRSNVSYLEKVNRGRDISALLVAAKPVIKQYKFICFIHDKSSNAEYLKKDVEFWKKSLWDNMLCSSDYIHNILQIFLENPDLGLLVPPEPYGDYNSHWYGDTWRDDYQLTIDLAKKLNIKADISAEKEVFTLSTVFWARTKALKKLLDYNWTYKDFPKEPLPVDGTINHAIERIIGYSAFDAGYRTGTVMTQSYAIKLLLMAQQDMRTMFFMIAKKEHIFNMHQVRSIETWKIQLKQYICNHAKAFIYGAGNYGYAIKKIMDDNRLTLSGFIVSPGRKKINQIENIDIYELQELYPQKDIGIIVGVSYEYREEIHTLLRENGFSDYFDGF